VIAATNRPDMVDPALLRAGRFDRLLLVPAPDAETRLEILSVHMKNMHLADDLNIHDLVERTVNFAGSDLENLCREAVMIALREEISIKEVSQRHFGEALKLVRPSLNSDIIKYYQEMADKLLQKMSSSATIADDFK
ncbi:MAG: AAA family ATPase, partial [Candidatus Heimdallarchaeota archaeon]|nr:AAA family ATPase [Candidatus Heimdallarchaeota archaeon]MCK5049479.1 AAA family ATPase [Candidatus Heimdallarchaeota archaeon]